VLGADAHARRGLAGSGGRHQVGLNPAGGLPQQIHVEPVRLSPETKGGLLKVMRPYINGGAARRYGRVGGKQVQR